MIRFSQFFQSVFCLIYAYTKYEVSIYSTISRLVKLGLGCVSLLWYSLNLPFEYLFLLLQFTSALDKVVVVTKSVFDNVIGK